MGGTEISGLILTPSTLTLSLSLLEIAHFLELGVAPKELLALTSGQALNIEPTLSQISEETLESLKLRERNSRKNFERQTALSSQPTNEGHPQSDVMQRHAGFPQDTQISDQQLKASIKQNLYKVAESCGIYL